MLVGFRKVLASGSGKRYHYFGDLFVKQAGSVHFRNRRFKFFWGKKRKAIPALHPNVVGHSKTLSSPAVGRRETKHLAALKTHCSAGEVKVLVMFFNVATQGHTRMFTSRPCAVNTYFWFLRFFFSRRKREVSGIVMSTLSERPAITEIDDHISICSADDDPQDAADKGYTGLLNLADNVNYGNPSGVEYHHVRLTDDGQNSCERVERAVDTLEKMVKSGKRVLVHCRSGVSRAPSIVAAYYARQGRHSLQSALEAIKDKRNIVSPHPEFFSVLSMCEAMRKTPVV